MVKRELQWEPMEVKSKDPQGKGSWVVPLHKFDVPESRPIRRHPVSIKAARAPDSENKFQTDRQTSAHTDICVLIILIYLDVQEKKHSQLCQIMITHSDELHVNLG